MTIRLHQIGCLTAFAALFAAAATGLATSTDGGAAPRPVRAYAMQPAPDVPAHAEPADLSEIRFSRRFRVLVATPPPTPDRLTAPDDSFEIRGLVERFAEEQFLLPTFVQVVRREDLMPALLRGDGDLIGSPMRIRDYRRGGAAFTVPVDSLREVLVVRSGDRIESAEDLRGREITLAERSTFWPVVNRMRREVPGIRVRTIPGHLRPEIVLQRVDSLEYDMAVLDPRPVELGVGRWERLRAVPQFASSGSLSLGVHPRAQELKNALDDFLTREQLARQEPLRRSDDLDGIARNGVLRVLTRNNASSFFIWRGRPLGFEYELISKFADEHDLSLEMIVGERRDELLPALRRGEVDVVAAGLADVPERRGGGIAFTRPYKESYEVVVTRAGDESLAGPADLAGRTVTARQSSPAWRLLRELIDDGLDVRLEAAPEDLESEELIARVASGIYDVTVADAYSVKVALTWRDDVRSAFTLDGPLPVAWAVRESNPKLLAALDGFIEREFRQVDYNVIHARYFENPRTIRSHVAHRSDRAQAGNPISPFDDIVRRQAEKHGFDWLLIVAMIYRESRFDPRVESWAGARGLMQLMPVTARRFGVRDPADPEQSIVGGLRLLAWLYQQLEPELPVKDRTWFALAAYNAGLGHLLDARRLAREQGLDPNRWFGNVEKAMLLLSQPRHHRRARHGYVRGTEPVSYVRDIRELYNAYRRILRS